VFVTNHSHNDTGDLYIGPNYSATVESVRLCITSRYSLISSSFSSIFSHPVVHGGAISSVSDLFL
jgi:hypothetical protein